MNTVCLQIGNSDNKLTQEEWSKFVFNINDVISAMSTIHFAGGSGTEKPWQNFCWVFIPAGVSAHDNIIREVIVQREAYKQESVAWLEGETKFI